MPLLRARASGPAARVEEARLALSSDRRLRGVRFGVRVAVTQLNLRTRWCCALLTALALSAVPAVPVTAAPTPAPHPHAAPTWPVPKVPLHCEIIAQTNAKGQVVSAKIDKPSPDKFFNAQVYGNALQAFIRTPDGHAVTGQFRLTYDYDPKSVDVKRQVAFIKAGGDPDAPGAVSQMIEMAKKGQQHALEQQKAAAQAAQQKAAADAAHHSPLPDLNHILASPAPSPAHT